MDRPTNFNSNSNGRIRYNTTFHGNINFYAPYVNKTLLVGYRKENNGNSNEKESNQGETKNEWPTKRKRNI